MIRDMLYGYMGVYGENIGICFEILRKYSMKINEQKTKSMIISRKRISTEEGKLQQVELSGTNGRIYNEIVEITAATGSLFNIIKMFILSNREYQKKHALF